MDDFNKAEWMEENCRREGTRWEPMPQKKRPEFEFCDIRLGDDREIGPCWPGQNDFVDLSSENEDLHPFSEVTHVRYYIHQLLLEEDEAEEDEEDD
jgi:hypothetical protein